MKINTKKKFMGKFFQSKKNKKAAAATVVEEEIPVLEIEEERPEPEGRQAEAEEEIETALKPDPSVDDEGLREEVDEREAAPEAEEDNQDDEVTMNIETNNTSGGSWMGGLLENVTYMCGPTPTNQPLPTIMSEEDVEMEDNRSEAAPETPKAQDPPEEIPAEEEVAPVPQDTEAAVVVETVTEEVEDEAAIEEEEPALVEEKEEEEEATNREPSGTKIDIFAGLTGLCFNPPLQSMDELELQEEDTIEDTPDETCDEVGAGEPLVEEEINAQYEEQREAPAEEENVPVSEAESNTDVATLLSTDSTEVTIGTIHKEKRNTKMGLSLKNSTMLQGVFIAKIKPNSLFSKTDLREGMKVLQIQGESCPVVLEDAVTMLRRAEGELEIVAEKPKCEI